MGNRRLLIIFGCFLFHNLRINKYCEVILFGIHWLPFLTVVESSMTERYPYLLFYIKIRKTNLKNISGTQRKKKGIFLECFNVARQQLFAFCVPRSFSGLLKTFLMYTQLTTRTGHLPLANTALSTVTISSIVWCMKYC